MKDNPFVVSSHEVAKDSKYRKWLFEVKNRYKVAQIKSSVKINSEQLLFNWLLGRNLVVLRAEEKWGNGVVEELSLDLQDAFPGVKGFSARNLWFMKQWYSFYASKPESIESFSVLDRVLRPINQKLKQVASEIEEPKLKQPDSEFPFPIAFGYVPWMYHILIVQKFFRISGVARLSDIGFHKTSV